MKNVISATKARNNFFDMLNAVIYKGEEFVIEKKDAGIVRMVPYRPKYSPEEVGKILKEFRRVFAKAAKRKYWSVIDTPVWKKKESKYLKDLSKGIIS